MYSTILSLQSRCMWFENHKKLELVKPTSCASLSWCLVPICIHGFHHPISIFCFSCIKEQRLFQEMEEVRRMDVKTRQQEHTQNYDI